jgi:hypothetical protein
MRHRTLAFFVFLLLLAAGTWVLAEHNPFEVKERVDRVELIQKTFYQTRAGVYWKDKEGSHLWTSSYYPARKFTRTPSGVVCTIRPMGACDSQSDCEEALDLLCADAGWVGVNADTVQVTRHVDMSKTCSGDCQEGCNANGCPVAFIICEENNLVTSYGWWSDFPGEMYGPGRKQPSWD